MEGKDADHNNGLCLYNGLVYRHLFPSIFVLFKQFYCLKSADNIGIRTRIVSIEGEHADHSTTALLLQHSVGAAVANIIN